MRKPRRQKTRSLGPQAADSSVKAKALDPRLFELSSQKLPAKQHAAALAQLKSLHCEQQSNFLGFQANQERFPHLEGLEDFLYYQMNNLGDPFRDGNFTLNSKCLERVVLDYYATLWHGRPHQEKDPESCWGYVLTMGSTEGNLYGLWNAREYLSGGALLEDPSEDQEAKQASADGQPRRPRKRLIYSNLRRTEDERNRYQPVIFCSEDTHYSIHKAVKALKIKTFAEIGNERFPTQNPLAPGTRWPDGVPSEGGEAGQGSIDCDKLAVLVEFFARKGYPILVFFNYGTTFKGAYDDVERAGKLLMPILERHGLYERVVEVGSGGHQEIRHGFWFHVDGALGAAYMPFLEMAHEADQSIPRGPNFDFRLPFVHSLVMSGHKWIGAPWPCGIYMTKTRLQLRPPDNPEYIGALDTTFAGSRNGFSALLLWNYLANTSHEAQIQRALHTEEMAQYAFDQLQQLQKEKPGVDLWVARSPCSLTIRFKEANEEIRFRYSLSGESFFVDGRKRSYSHIFAMPHVTKRMIDALIEDLRKPDAFPIQKEVLEVEEEVTGPLAELRERLAAVEELVGRDLLIRRFAGELVFRSPRAEIVNRYSLETETLYLSGRKRNFSRLDSGADLDLLEEMLHDLSQPEAFDPDDEETEERLEDLRRTLFAHAGRGFK
jgi:histidine decarboxylase